MNRHGIIPGRECPLFSDSVPTFEAIADIVLPSAHTALFLAVDARGIPSEAVGRIAGGLLASGLIRVCVWGPDCERIHDIFDEVHVGDGLAEPGFTLMSTWHGDETLEEALGFFVDWATVEAGLPSTSCLAVTVGNPGWEAVVRHHLAGAARPVPDSAGELEVETAMDKDCLPDRTS
jgi:hypothetical protein